MFESIAAGFALFATIDNFIALAAGVAIGVFIGAIPGIAERTRNGKQSLFLSESSGASTRGSSR